LPSAHAAQPQCPIDPAAPAPPLSVDAEAREAEAKAGEVDAEAREVEPAELLAFELLTALCATQLRDATTPTLEPVVQLLVRPGMGRAAMTV
jgi:hypothetical protein